MIDPDLDTLSPPPVPMARKRALGRRRAGAVAVSALLHVVLVLAMLSSATGAMVMRGGGAPQDDDNLVIISLAGLRGGARPHAQAQTQPSLDAMLNRARAETEIDTPAADPTRPATTQAVDRLFDEISRERQANDPGHGTGGRADQDRGGSGAQADASDQQARNRAAKDSRVADAGQAAGKASTGALWGQVEPCWRKLPRASATAVTLEVVLDRKGLVASSPRIIRPANAILDGRRMVAEARALQALANCTPYRGSVLADAQRTFKLEFGASR